MHIMCVRGVYVTDPAHNIIFGGKCPALFDRFFWTSFFVLFAPPFFSFDVFRVLRFAPRVVRRFSVFCSHVELDLIPPGASWCWRGEL